MNFEIEKLIKFVFKKWLTRQPKLDGAHPDEELLACFSEGMLSEEENQQVKQHLISCDDCLQKIILQAKVSPDGAIGAPEGLITEMKNLARDGSSILSLEIIFKLKDDLLELINTTGDILVGQELMPALVLRSRKIKDFKDEVIIFKDFNDVRVEIKLVNRQSKAFDLTVFAKEKQTQKIIKDLRITLLKDDLEIESYHTDSGRVIFENVLLGKYMIEIIGIDSKLAAIILDIKT
ncbi:MAG: zf-HC2 domain-containing protein [Candidatus Omnitrophica bacterium]|jgi:hypothetical protein|nr:zf-HC2 domain-containing protein [Candidatus Omnitrophota bacterium]